MAMEKGLDTGGVYCALKLPLRKDEFADTLEQKLGELAAAAAPEIISKILNGELRQTPQNHAEATVCSKIKKTDGIIDWNEAAEKIAARIRAYRPWPGCRAQAFGPAGPVMLSITEASAHPEMRGIPGTVLECGKKGLIVACGEGALEITGIAAPGKKPVTAAAFLNGLRGAGIDFTAEA